eukprot:1157435-Pelagomonas_calceolata.AAC.2
MKPEVQEARRAEAKALPRASLCCARWAAWMACSAAADRQALVGPGKCVMVSRKQPLSASFCTGCNHRSVSHTHLHARVHTHTHLALPSYCPQAAPPAATHTPTPAAAPLPAAAAPAPAAERTRHTAHAARAGGAEVAAAASQRADSGP